MIILWYKSTPTGLSRSLNNYRLPVRIGWQKDVAGKKSGILLFFVVTEQRSKISQANYIQLAQIFSSRHNPETLQDKFPARSPGSIVH